MKKIKSLKKSQIFDSQLLRKEKCNRVWLQMKIVRL